jgi:MerR family mercuric resistance operon transcriptional regulator
MGTSRHFGIGALSEQTGVNIETIRYYEREGLMPAPPRTSGGHRSYSEDHLKRLTFIRRSRELGFSMAEIRGLLALVDERSYTCGEVKAFTLEHTESVRSKISDLQRMEKMLVEIASGCEGGTVPDCPIIDALLDLNAAATGSEEHIPMKD